MVDGGLPEGTDGRGDQLSHQVKKSLKIKVADPDLGTLVGSETGYFSAIQIKFLKKLVSSPRFWKISKTYNKR